jgi:hypothetical protein
VVLAQYRTTSEFLARLGPVVLPAWDEVTSGRCRVRHARGVFTQEWAQGVRLPLDAPPRGRQKVALASATGSDEERMIRPGGQQALDAAYRQRPRTRVWESVNEGGADWTALTTVHLGRLLQRRVICTLYQSVAGDDSLGPHDDNWWGVITQLRGSKRWRIWDQPNPTDLVLTAGDVLLLPAGVQHQVFTPDESVHMVLAVTSEPIASA